MVRSLQGVGVLTERGLQHTWRESTQRRSVLSTLALPRNRIRSPREVTLVPKGVDTYLGVMTNGQFWISPFSQTPPNLPPLPNFTPFFLFSKPKNSDSGTGQPEIPMLALPSQCVAVSLHYNRPFVLSFLGMRIWSA